MPATSTMMSKPLDIPSMPPRASSPVTEGGESPRGINGGITSSSNATIASGATKRREISVGVLLAGTISDGLSVEHGSYTDMYSELLKSKGGDKCGVDCCFKLIPYEITRGRFPGSAHTCDAWLVSGSVSCANDGDAWIARLEELIREIYSFSIPMVGVCFGHQIMAKALGGKVEKHPIGYSAGVRDYIFNGALTPLVASHGDQVTVKPRDAEVVGYADYLRYAALRYPNNAFSIQPHPEFTPDFMQALLHKLHLDPEPIDRTAQLKSISIAHYIRKFLSDCV